MTLPLFLTYKWKYPAGMVMFGLAYVAYMTTNHYPIFPPVTLPMTPIDNAIPFIPETVLIYTSEYLFFTVVYMTCNNMENLNKYLYSFFILQLFSCAIFLLWPTIYPRELYPISEDLPRSVKGVWAWLRITDAPTNCFPSLHVSSVYLSAYLFLDEQREKFPYFFVWATLIAISTLPTKQHYFIDVIAGWLLSFAAYWIFHKWMKYVKIGPLAHQANR